MQKIKATSLNTLGGFMRGQAGLVLGPSITVFPGVLGKLSEALASLGSVQEQHAYIDLGQELLDKGIPEAKFREAVRTFFGQQQRSSMLSHVAKTKWAAVLSAALDLHFEDLYNAEAVSRIGWQPMTVMADANLAPPPGTVPAFKLLGSCARDDFVVSEVTYLRCRRTWRQAVRVFSDRIKGNPVLCLGMGDCPWLLEDLVAEMLGDPYTSPAVFLLLSDDPIAENRKIQQLFEQSGRLLVLDDTVGNVTRAMARSMEPAAQAPTGGKSEFDAFVVFDATATLVNLQLTPEVSRDERHRLLDMLFSPHVPRWDPLAHDLDFRRTANSDLNADITGLLGTFDEGAVLLTGNSASGKSMVMKRLAFDLAKAGELVFWLRPWFGQDKSEALYEVFRQAKRGKEPKSRVVVMMDDPLRCGTLSPSDVTAAARRADISILLVVAARTTDSEVRSRADLVGGLSVLHTYGLPDNLDAAEWSALPSYLAAIGAAKSQKDAEQQVGAVTSRRARDTLATLYWLLPSTRVAIQSSIRDEYNRLGDIAGLTSVIAGSFKISTDKIRAAYELVAVAEHFGGGLPIEVLVGALGIDYTTWLALSKPESPVWGIFYDEVSHDGGTILYHCRNDIVMQVIIETLNGGAFGHSGEIRVLSALISACAGHTSAVYHEFLANVLLPYNKVQLQRFNGTEGLTLYEKAIQGFPKPDRTFLHHLGLWRKTKCDDPTGAKEDFTKALAAKDFPYTGKHDPDEYIHTSLAAATVVQVDRKEIDHSQGKKEVLFHLSAARSNGNLSARVVHVQANMLLRLADYEESKGTPDFMLLLNRALGDIDEMLLLLSYGKGDFKDATTDVQLLEKARDDVLAYSLSIEELTIQAEAAWVSFGSQEGFVLICRKLFADAVRRNKGYASPYHKALEYIRRIANDGKIVASSLYDVALEIFYFWRVRLYQSNPSSTEIEWLELEKLAVGALQRAEDPKSTFIMHVYALTLAHLGKWTDAQAIYNELRRRDMPGIARRATRDYLLNEKGGERLVQGVLHDGQGRRYLHVDALGTDFIIDSSAFRRRRDGETVHAYIRFTFQGPLATDRL